LAEATWQAEASAQNFPSVGIVFLPLCPLTSSN